MTASASSPGTLLHEVSSLASRSTLQHLPTRVAAEVAHRVMRVVDPPGRLPANVSFGRVTGSQNSPSPCALTTSLTSNTSVHGPHGVHAAGLTLATVVGEPHCCSALTVNTSNTVQLPTFEQLYYGVRPHIRISHHWTLRRWAVGTPSQNPNPYLTLSRPANGPFSRLCPNFLFFLKPQPAFVIMAMR